MRRLSMLAALTTLAAGLLLATPSTAGAGGFCSDEPFTDGRGTSVDLKGNCMRPTILRVEPGTTVEFRNHDATQHMLGGVQNIFGNLHTEVGSKQSVAYTFKDEGVFPYLCILHPGMAGAIVVGDGEGKVGYTSVTGTTSSSGDPAVEQPSTDVETRPVVADTPSNIWLLLAIAIATAGGLWWFRRRPQAEA